MHGHLVGCAILKYIAGHLLYRGLHRRALTSFVISTVLETNNFDALNIRFLSHLPRSFLKVNGVGLRYLETFIVTCKRGQNFSRKA